MVCCCVCARAGHDGSVLYTHKNKQENTHTYREKHKHTHTQTHVHTQRDTHTQVDEITVTVVPRVLGAGVTPCLRYVSASLPVSMPVCVYICLPIYVPIRTYIYMHACIHKSAPPHARTHRQTRTHTHRGAIVCDSNAAAQPATAAHARSRRGPRATRLPHRQACSMSGETQRQDRDKDRV